MIITNILLLYIGVVEAFDGTAFSGLELQGDGRSGGFVPSAYGYGGSRRSSHTGTSGLTNTTGGTRNLALGDRFPLLRMHESNFATPKLDKNFYIKELEKVITGQTKEALAVCTRNPHDFVLVVDESGSISKDNWINNVYNFVKLITNAIAEADGDNRIAIVKYATFPKEIFRLTKVDKSTIAAINCKIDDMFEARRTYGLTFTGSALELVRTKILDPEGNFILDLGSKDQPGDKNTVVLVITDGTSTDKAKAIEESKIIRFNGVHLFVFGIGSVIKRECRKLVGCPEADDSKCPGFIMSDWDNVLNYVGEMLENLCIPSGSNAICQSTWSDFTECDKPCGTGTRTSKLVNLTIVREATIGYNGVRGLTCEEQFKDNRVKTVLCNTHECSETVETTVFRHQPSDTPDINDTEVEEGKGTAETPTVVETPTSDDIVVELPTSDDTAELSLDDDDDDDDSADVIKKLISDTDDDDDDSADVIKKLISDADDDDDDSADVIKKLISDTDDDDDEEEGEDDDDEDDALNSVAELIEPNVVVHPEPTPKPAIVVDPPHSDVSPPTVINEEPLILRPEPRYTRKVPEVKPIVVEIPAFANEPETEEETEEQEGGNKNVVHVKHAHKEENFFKKFAKNVKHIGMLRKHCLLIYITTAFAAIVIALSGATIAAVFYILFKEKEVAPLLADPGDLEFMTAGDGDGDDVEPSENFQVSNADDRIWA